MTMKRITTLLRVLALAGAIAPMWAQAADFPSKPVRVVVPYSPGGPADALMRAVGQKLSDKWGQPVIVENRPGANEIIGADTVIKAAPDGYTLLLGSEAAFSLNPQLYAKLSYKPADLAPVSRLVTAQLMLVTRPDFPADDVAGLIKHLKANPGKYTYGITGIGGVLHLAGAWFNQLYGVQTSEVPYKGLPLAMQDVMAGRVDMLFAIAGGPMPHVATGKLKAIALAGPHRVAIAPDVPTFAQAGYLEFDASVYFALAAPAGTPEDVRRKVADDVGAVVSDADFVARNLTAIGFEPVRETPQAFAAFLELDRGVAAQRVQAAGVKLDQP
ncbi:Bug family tripartite tricarboxylate transporter substrate binding protein [Bordetella parapertussis]|uniref:Exported protein n=1 Tax=Bordetella parapertussis (strain Bpp5) TaxID=1208660 RepID=K0M9A8_BORPB|nr:putative exported protein [Bordetella parapertussis Bpp5]